ncbi:MAG: ATP-binding cassette domain-containing protein [Brevinematales bacterium]|jgi:ABC-2 type transport system ATP-binding protein
MFAVNVENLSRKFKDVLAVDNISFNVKAGELFGFLGPNGAGKTTTINMLSTLIRPGSGDARVMGFDIRKQRDQVRKSIGVVFQEPALDSRLTGRENLEFHAMMYSMKKSDRMARIKEVLELVELTNKAGKKVETYSGGMKRRLEIARGLMHRPEILFLDEPTIGLDSQTRRHIWDYIKKLNRETGITMMLTTHYMEEADYLCDRILIIDYGKIVALDTPSNLKNILGGDVVDLEIKGANGSCAPLAQEFEKLEWIKTVKEHECSLSLTMNSGETRIPQLVSIAAGRNIEISSINLHKPSLDDVFIHFTGKTIREQAN